MSRRDKPRKGEYSKPQQRQKGKNPPPTQPREKGKRSTTSTAPLLQPGEKAINLKKLLFYYIGIFLFTFALYANTYNHTWVLDDYGAFKLNIYVTKGVDGYKDILTKTYRHGSGFYTDNLYRPFSQLIFATLWQISPDNPGLYHLVNAFFYALCAVLLFALLRKMFVRQHLLIPLLITALYAAHPMHTEVVANIKGLDDIMSLFFLLLTMIFTLRFVEATNLRSRILNIVAVFLFFLCAFFSKENAITMLPIIPLMIYFFRKAPIKDYVVVIVALLIPTAIYLYTRFSILSNYPSSKDFTVSIMDHYYYDLYDKNIFSYWATAIMLLGKYLLLLFIPYEQVCDYSYSQLPFATFASWTTLLSLIVHLGLLIYAISQIKKKNPVAFGILFYICTMSIFSNLFIRIGSSFADRFLFLPSLGFCIAIVCFIFQLFKNKVGERVSFSKASSKIIVIGFVIIITLFSTKTILRAADWVDQMTLFGKDVQKSDNSAHMRLYWGLALRDKGLDYKDANEGEKDWNVIQENNKKFIEWTWKAIEQFKKGISIYPGSADCNEQLGIAYDNLYPFYPEEKYRDTAEYYYLNALKIVPSKAATNSNVAKIYFDRGEIQKAKKYYLYSIFYDPLFADGYFNLGSSYGMLGLYDSSFYYYRKCLTFTPDRAECYTFMGLNYTNLGNIDSALAMYKKAISINKYSNNAYILIAKLYLSIQKFDEAEAITNDALEANPYNGEAYFIKGLLKIYGKETQVKDYDGAMADFSKCIKYAPEIAEAYVEKGRIFDMRHQRDSAQFYYEIAFNMNPNLFVLRK